MVDGPNLNIEQTIQGFHRLDMLESPNPVRIKSEALAVHPEIKSQVWVNEQRIGEVAEILADFNFTPPTWDFSAGDIPLYPQFQEKEQLLRHFLVLSSINYEYIHFGQVNEAGEELRFSDGILSGAELATSRITQHWGELRDPEFLRDISLDYLENTLFDAKISCPQIHNRQTCLRSVGSFLSALDAKGESLTDMFEMYGGDAVKVSRHLQTWVVGFQDDFGKRSQLYVGMVQGRFQNRDDNPVDLASVPGLTMFADYRVPQTQINWGQLEVSEGLRDHLMRRGTIMEDSIWGQGLRAAPIVIGDMTVAAINAIRAERSPDGNFEPVTCLGLDAVQWAAPRQYKKAIQKGDDDTAKKLEVLLSGRPEVPPPYIPTIKL